MRVSWKTKVVARAGGSGNHGEGVLYTLYIGVIDLQKDRSEEHDVQR